MTIDLIRTANEPRKKTVDDILIILLLYKEGVEQHLYYNVTSYIFTKITILYSYMIDVHLQMIISYGCIYLRIYSELRKTENQNYNCSL